MEPNVAPIFWAKNSIIIYSATLNLISKKFSVKAPKHLMKSSWFITSVNGNASQLPLPSLITCFVTSTVIGSNARSKKARSTYMMSTLFIWSLGIRLCLVIPRIPLWRQCYALLNDYEMVRRSSIHRSKASSIHSSLWVSMRMTRTRAHSMSTATTLRNRSSQIRKNIILPNQTSSWRKTQW